MTPRATYRLQFNQNFGFREAAKIAPYLAQLGISHVYSSPWLKARSGSTHGYDIVDHQHLNPELGTQDDFDCMVKAFRANNLGQILDFVPNHMGVGGADNLLWIDVLEWGPESLYAGWFDIEWQSDRSYLHNKLLLPFLGDQYGVELYGGKLQLRFDAEAGSFAVWAYDAHKFPICPLHYGRILGDAIPELERLSDSFANLLDWKPQVARRTLELKAQLAALARQCEDVRNEIAASIETFHGGDWKRLNDLIQDQYWRAADFRVAADDINYRRFFNVNDLAGIRMELPEVFEHTHYLVAKLFASGTIDGLRIDHVDGLLNPKEYLCRVRSEINPDYLIVEKVLARHENLREDWPVDGTTGYEFTNQVLGVLIDPDGTEEFTRIYADWIGHHRSFRDILRDSKLRIMRNEMASELDVLAREVARVARENPRTADFTHNVLRRALREIVACFPVYRTYVDRENVASKEDCRDLHWAVSQARANEKDLDSTVFDFLQALLSGSILGEGRSGFSRHAVLRCAMKFQQFSGPVMAKGLEDTAFYQYNRFVALNEVGGDPERFGIKIPAFHRSNEHRAKRWPHTMLTTSTHDTKRGEDARARLAVLSEMPEEWAAQVSTWSRILRARRRDLGAIAPPDRNDEYLLYQTLIGSWPTELIGSLEHLDQCALATYIERLKGATTKSIREAKLHSTWKSPNLDYENAVLSFIDDIANTQASDAFFSSFLPFQEKIARLGVENSLVQLTLKLTSPGVPDLYQGSELWDLSMVDPDNRRPVNFDSMSRLLRDAGQNTSSRLLQNWRDGAVKMFVTSRLLSFRNANADLFTNGSYNAVPATGAKADYICSFERSMDDQHVLVVTGRFPARREADPHWHDTTLPLPSVLHNRRLYDALTGRELHPADSALSASDLFAELPIAVVTARTMESNSL